MSLASRLANFTSSNRQRRSELGSSAETTVLAAKHQWILSRGLCRFQRQDFSALPAKSREQALELTLRQSAPFTEFDYCVVWQGAHALVWLWDARQVGDLLTAQGVSYRSGMVLPETLLQAAGTTGPLLRQCINGAEGQLWRDGALEATRWWAKTPTTEEWQLFVRHAGESAQASLPALRPREFLAAPWARSKIRQDIVKPQFKAEGYIYAALLFALGWYAISLLHVKLQLAQQAKVVQRETSALRSAASTIVSARDAATRDADATAALTRLYGYPAQTELMAMVMRMLPTDGTSLHGWDFQRGKLKITFSNTGGNIAVSRLVEQLEAAPQFSKVEVVPSDDLRQLVVTLRVNPLLPKPNGDNDDQG